MQDFSWNTFFGRGAIIAVVLILLGIFFINQFYFIVEPGEIGLIKTMGSLNERVYTQGINFKLPFVQTSVIMNIQTQKLENTAASASQDLQRVEAKVALNYAFEPSHIRKLYENFGSERIIESRIIIPAIEESIKASTAQFRAEDLITTRLALSERIKEKLIAKLENQWVKVIGVNVINIDFTEDFDAAIEAKVKAEQEALTEKNRLETIKFKAEQQIAAAEGAAQAKILEAEAEAEAIRLQTQAIREQGGSEYVQLQWINKRDGVLPTTSVGENTPLILDMSQWQ